ncbi:MAG: hypothetical protein V2B18_14300 [Pseudomonadota bacterium]
MPEQPVGKNIIRLAADSETPDWEPGEEITEWDHAVYRRLVSVELSPEQRAWLVEPTKCRPKQKSVLAIHWHPEYIPLDLVVRRVKATFPEKENELVIPTQHNILLSLDGYSGVEVDCYAPEFNRKIQLLLHFKESEADKAHVLRSMLAHTFQYRSGQLFEFIDSIVNPAFEDRLNEAVAETGANEEVIRFARLHADKMRRLIELNESTTPAEMIKNKLLSEYYRALAEHHSEFVVNRALQLIKAVKAIVKRNFSLEYFYNVHEIIEETRSLGGGVVVPHPEQFWPVLLADYGVDGYEVWNPQSREYTEFLINVVNKQNRGRSRGRSLLIFMGDDTHMGEKAKPPASRDPDSAAREVGVQPAWDDFAIRKSLIVANAGRNKAITEYTARLG